MSTNKVVEKIKELIVAPRCYSGLKTIAQEYLVAVGTATEKTAGEKIVNELEENVETIDELIDFLNSDMGAQILGAQAKKINVSGGKYCFSLACTAGKAMLDMKDEIM